MEQLAGQTAFITGGAQGIGLGIARALGNAGVRLAIADFNEQALHEAEAALAPLTPTLCLRLDVRDRDGFARAADEAESRLGPVSILCNNAGIAGAASIHEMSYAFWDAVLGINLGGVVNGIQTFLPRMLARGQPGHIVNTAAGAGLAVGGGVSGFMYQTSKYAVVGLSESLRKQLQLAERPIGVTVLCPGPVPTNIAATTLGALPDSIRNVSPEEQKIRDLRVAMMNAYLAQGVPPDRVGDMVIDGILRNRLYVHTDRTMHDAIVARTKALLEAMPEIEGPSTSSLLNAEFRGK